MYASGFQTKYVNYKTLLLLKQYYIIVFSDTVELDIATKGVL